MSNNAHRGPSVPPVVAVEDFGPIARADVELRPLTVFVGPSNTGKSYLAILLYALHRVFSGYGRFSRTGPAHESLAEPSLRTFRRWADQLPTPASGRARSDVTLPGDLGGLLKEVYDGLGGVIDSELARCFGTDVRQLRRLGSKGDRRVSIRHPDGQGLSITLRLHGLAVESELPANVTIRRDQLEVLRTVYAGSRKRRGGRTGEERYSRDELVSLAAMALPRLAGVFGSDAYYLPADRTGIMHAHSALVSALISSAAMTAVRPAARAPALSGVVADFLEELIGLASDRHWGGPGQLDAAERLERELLRGAVAVEKSDALQYPRFAYLPEGWKRSLPLMRASSMVSELAPLVLYLRHRVRTGNLLVVEEPESHLHPAMQVEVTRQIARLVQAGVRVLVTTHSEWVLEELANIVGRARVAEKKRAVCGSDVALAPDRVGVWLFEPKKRPKGTVVREAKLDDSGLFATGFDDVAVALHNDWAEATSLGA